MLETHGYWSVLCAVAQIRESREQLRLTNFAPSGITGICHTQDFRAWGGVSDQRHVARHRFGSLPQWFGCSRRPLPGGDKNGSAQIADEVFMNRRKPARLDVVNDC